MVVILISSLCCGTASGAEVIEGDPHLVAFISAELRASRGALIPEEMLALISVAYSDEFIDNIATDLQKKTGLTIRYFRKPQVNPEPRPLSLNADSIKVIDLLTVISISCNVDVNIHGGGVVEVLDR